MIINKKLQSEKNFKKGQKPALDFGLSVSRLGGAVQKDSIKKIGAAVRRELLTYLETADVYQLVKIDAMSKELQEKVDASKDELENFIKNSYIPKDNKYEAKLKEVKRSQGEILSYKQLRLMPFPNIHK